MIRYVIRRLMILAPLLFVLSVLSFVLIQLPPGSYIDTYVARLKAQGFKVGKAEIESLKQRYGLDEPIYVQYYKWMRNFLQGDLGRSFQDNRANIDLVSERLPITVMISLLSMIFVYVVAVPIGIFSAIHQYSKLDYLFTSIGFFGLAVPNFLFALVLMWVVFANTGYAITGLFSREFLDVPWSLAKLADMFKHIWVALIVIGTAGTAGLIRVLRGTLLDELGKQYVITARAKGLEERKLLFKYPVRMAINPVISTIGWMLPAIVSGEAITAIVLNIRSIGPLLLNAVLTQDMYLAASIIMILGTLTVIGTLISDMLLAWLDPRIRYGT